MLLLLYYLFYSLVIFCKKKITPIFYLSQKKKKNEPRSISDYRPISLGNVVSHVVSKVLANKLKLILPNVISDSQSAFVPNQLITDNTTVAFEVFHKMRNKRIRKKGQMEIKLDISKAYDQVEWAFLQQIVLKLGIDGRWVRLAMETIHTASYSILINGEPKGYHPIPWYKARRSTLPIPVSSMCKEPILIY